MHDTETYEYRVRSEGVVQFKGLTSRDDALRRARRMLNDEYVWTTMVAIDKRAVSPGETSGRWHAASPLLTKQANWGV